MRGADSWSGAATAPPKNTLAHHERFDAAAGPVEDTRDRRGSGDAAGYAIAQEVWEEPGPPLLSRILTHRIMLQEILEGGDCPPSDCAKDHTFLKKVCGFP